MKYIELATQTKQHTTANCWVVREYTVKSNGDCQFHLSLYACCDVEKDVTSLYLNEIGQCTLTQEELVLDIAEVITNKLVAGDITVGQYDFTQGIVKDCTC